MGIAEDILGPDGWHASLAALAWQHDLGVTEVIGDMAVDRYDLPPPAREIAPAPAPDAKRPDAAPPRPAAAPEADQELVLQTAIAAAKGSAARAASLADLRGAVAGFDHCEIKRGARNLVFADGNPAAKLMILTEGPQRDEDQEGRPMIGAVGALFDKMFAAIGLSRAAPLAHDALYIATVVPWNPPGDRSLTDAEIAMMRPFVERHIALQNPDVIVAMGNGPLMALTGRQGISRARGQWVQALGKPVLPMLHPSQLLTNPGAKRDAWADLLSLPARLRG